MSRDNWFLYKNHLQFFDRKIAFVDDLPKVSTKDKIRVNYILLRKKSKETMARLEQFYEFDKIILDGALSTHRIIDLKKECQAKNILYHDINQDGALIINLD